MLLEISLNSQENTRARASFLIKLTLPPVFSCEFGEISKNTFLAEPLWETASEQHSFKSWADPEMPRTQTQINTEAAL